MKEQSACVRCGSADLTPPAIGSGDAFLPGVEDLMGTAVCERCGYKGVPLLFDDPEALAAYRDERERAGWSDWKVVGEGMSALPSVDAMPQTLGFPLVVLLAGVALLVAGFAFVGLFLRTSDALLLLTAAAPLLLGAALALTGWRLVKKAREGNPA